MQSFLAAYQLHPHSQISSVLSSDLSISNSQQTTPSETYFVHKIIHDICPVAQASLATATQKKHENRPYFIRIGNRPNILSIQLLDL